MRSLRSILAQSASTSTKTSTHLNNDENNSSSYNTNSSELIKKANSLIDPEIYCERGLESHQSKERINLINMNRKLHMSLVIGEQTRQRQQQQQSSSMADDDQELIRNISMIQSKNSSLEAQLLAAIDQQEVVQENDNNNDNDNNSNSNSNDKTSQGSSGKHKHQQPSIGILQKIQEHYHHRDNSKVIPMLSGSSNAVNNERRNLYNLGTAIASNDAVNGYHFCAAPASAPCITASLDTPAIDTKNKKTATTNFVASLFDKRRLSKMALSQNHQHQHQQCTTDSYLKPAQYYHHHPQQNTTNRAPATTITASTIMSNSVLATAFQLEQGLLHHHQTSQQQQRLHQQLLLFQHQQQQQQCYLL
jgi:hypothetical protein